MKGGIILRQRKKARPIVFIDQPDFSMPQASMQGEYHSSNDDRPAVTPKTQRPIRLPQIKREQQSIVVESEQEKEVMIPVTEEDQNEVAVEEEEEKTNEQEDRKQTYVKKPFTKMTIAERIDYLVAPSTYTPRMKCEVATKDERFRGKIVAKEEGKIKFESFKHPKFHQIDINQIESIRLLGF